MDDSSVPVLSADAQGNLTPVDAEPAAAAAAATPVQVDPSWTASATGDATSPAVVKVETAGETSGQTEDKAVAVEAKAQEIVKDDPAAAVTKADPAPKQPQAKGKKPAADKPAAAPRSKHAGPAAPKPKKDKKPAPPTADASEPAPSTTNDTPDAAAPAGDAEPTAAPVAAAPEKPRVPLPDRQRVQTGGIRKEKLTPEELEAKMARMRLQNEELQRRHEQAASDAAAYGAVEAEEKKAAAALRAQEREKRRVQAEINAERERVAARKYEQATGRAWDTAKLANAPPAGSSSDSPARNYSSNNNGYGGNNRGSPAPRGGGWGRPATGPAATEPVVRGSGQVRAPGIGSPFNVRGRGGPPRPTGPVRQWGIVSSDQATPPSLEAASRKGGEVVEAAGAVEGGYQGPSGIGDENGAFEWEQVDAGPDDGDGQQPFAGAAGGRGRGRGRGAGRGGARGRPAPGTDVTAGIQRDVLPHMAERGRGGRGGGGGGGRGGRGRTVGDVAAEVTPSS